MRHLFSLRRAALAIALVSLLTGSIEAQNIGETTGSIRGVVKDDTGGVLPGATVTATSASLVGIRSAFPGILLGSAATTPVPVATYFAPGGYNYEAVIAAVPAANKDPRFMKGQLFQAPRALRLGLTLNF